MSIITVTDFIGQLSDPFLIGMFEAISPDYVVRKSLGTSGRNTICTFLSTDQQSDPYSVGDLSFYLSDEGGIIKSEVFRIKRKAIINGKIETIFRSKTSGFMGDSSEQRVIQNGEVWEINEFNVGVKKIYSPIQNGEYSFERGKHQVFFRTYNQTSKSGLAGWVKWTEKSLSVTTTGRNSFGFYLTKNGGVRFWKIHKRKFIAMSPKNIFWNKTESCIYSLYLQFLSQKGEISSWRWKMGAAFKLIVISGRASYSQTVVRNKLLFPIIRELNLYIPIEIEDSHSFTGLGELTKVLFGRTGKSLNKFLLSYKGNNLESIIYLSKLRPEIHLERLKGISNLTTYITENGTLNRVLESLPNNFVWETLNPPKKEEPDLLTDLLRGLEALNRHRNLLTEEKDRILKNVFRCSTLQGVHDSLAQEIITLESKEYSHVPYHMELQGSSEDGKLFFRTPKSVGEVIGWGKAQHHCIGNYARNTDSLLLQVNLEGERVFHSMWRKTVYSDRTVWSHIQSYHSNNEPLREGVLEILKKALKVNGLKIVNSIKEDAEEMEDPFAMD